MPENIKIKIFWNMSSYPAPFGDLDEWLGPCPCYSTFPVEPADRTMVVWDGGKLTRVNKQTKPMVGEIICPFTYLLYDTHTRGARDGIVLGIRRARLLLSCAARFKCVRYKVSVRVSVEKNNNKMCARVISLSQESRLKLRRR